ncbi:MAG TPA: peptidase M50 [Clostridia bacterium]|jgi:stage IV sporulation protein FB|nr:peptidase M50 [Clostridia bacterium]
MKVGKLFGVQLIINPYFLILIFLFSIIGLLPQALILFGVVILHELAHVLVAIGSGLNIKSVELLPFGGVARVEGLLGTNPEVEIKVALAGPINNLILIGLAYAFYRYNIWQEELTFFFIRCNFIMALFNLIPALPLDGGRIYRAKLSARMGFRRATELAANLGKLIGIILGIIGMVGFYFSYFNIIIIIIAFFLYQAAKKEKGMAAYIFLRYLTRKKEELHLKGVLVGEQLVAEPSTTLNEVLRLIVPQKYCTLLVLDNQSNIMGVLTEGILIDALLDHGGNLPVSQLLKEKNGENCRN